MLQCRCSSTMLALAASAGHHQVRPCWKLCLHRWAVPAAERRLMAYRCPGHQA